MISWGSCGEYFLIQAQDVKRICPYKGLCGGCKYIDMAYEQQLNNKLIRVCNLLKPYCKVERIIGMEKPYYYRNKIHATFGPNKKGKITSGRYAEGTRKMIPVDKCRIESEQGDAVVQIVTKTAADFGIMPYDAKTKQGLLRHVLVRVGFQTGQILVALVTSVTAFPSRKNFLRALLDKCPQITTVVQSVNGKDTGMILGEREEVLYGTGYIEDCLCGKVFRISAKSFYQVNSVQTEELYKTALAFAALTGNERVIDAYCGIGTVGITAADSCDEVIGCELNSQAVADAIVNKKRNQAKNVRFVCADAGEFMKEMRRSHQRADVVFTDPPRAGCSVDFINAMCDMQPIKIVYISCDPASLARDLKLITSKGYKAKNAVCVDMFPHTEHVETVVLLCLT